MFDVVWSSYLFDSSLSSFRNTSNPIKFVNTSMHGVSDKFVAQAFQELGLPLYIPVPEQQYPDPDFPSVLFPNPEEKGMDFIQVFFKIFRSFAGALVSEFRFNLIFLIAKAGLGFEDS